MAKIIGTPTVTPVPKTDFLQTDPTKADYLKGREHIATKEDVEIAAPSVGLRYDEDTGWVYYSVSNASVLDEEVF